VDSAARRLFRFLIEQPDEDIDLGRAALAVAAEEYDGLDSSLYQHRLDELATNIKSQLGEVSSLNRLAALIEYLSNVEGFSGNRRAYEDPRNSFLNEVLDRKVGVPLSLSLVYILVGRRLGLRMSGIAFPGHFLSRCDLDDGFVVVDAFTEGRQLSLDDCKELLRQTHREATFERGLLEPAPNRTVLFRMLANLKSLYLKSDDLPRALAALDRMVLITPNHPSILRDRGLVHLKLGRFPHALRDLERYQELAPDRAITDQPVLAASALMRRGKMRYLN
jgi:regulator of sirC expression with transglutaminase-like and TPR domain